MTTEEQNAEMRKALEAIHSSAHTAANGGHRYPGKAERIGDHKRTERCIAATVTEVLTRIGKERKANAKA